MLDLVNKKKKKKYTNVINALNKSVFFLILIVGQLAFIQTMQTHLERKRMDGETKRIIQSKLKEERRWK